MGQLQKVSWRTVGYAALGTVVAAASVVAIINSDGVRPTSLTSNAATRWLVDRINGTVVLVDGLAGRVVARVDAESQDHSEVAVQGAGGAFLVAKDQGSVRTISTAKLQLGTAQPVASLLDPDVTFGVGTIGLTVVSGKSGTANVVAVNDVTRRVNIPISDNALVAADGSMWLITGTQATHVNVDESRTTVHMRSTSRQTTTVGAHGVAYDDTRGTVRWIGGNDIDLQQSIPNPSDAVLQQPGDDARCVWLGSGDTLNCVGPTKVEQTLTIAGLHVSAGSGDRLAVAGDTAVVVGKQNQVARIDLEKRRMADDKDVASVPADAAKLAITASGNLVWLDDQGGDNAWVVNRFGINAIEKNDKTAPLLDAQGQVKTAADGSAGPGTGNGNAAGEDNADHQDHNGLEDPPHAVDDSVTARAGAPVTIPVTSNDWDPDGDPFAVSAVGSLSGGSAASGTVDILNGDSVTYVPNTGFNGIDTFNYTIVDPTGKTATATVTVDLFPPGSPNQPPIAHDDKAFTRVGQPITIDVLANDIDPERDPLIVAPFRQDAVGIRDAVGPTNLPALKYDPPDVPGIYRFTYQAVDPLGGTSQKANVVVTVSPKDAQNSPPHAQPDAIRQRVGVGKSVNVKANDTDPDGDDLTISLPQQQPNGVSVSLQGQQLFITLQPGALSLTVVQYFLSDNLSPPVPGKVLVLRIDDTAPNRPPVANPDSDRVVIGSSVKIPVTANDLDPDNDVITLLSAADPVDGSGTTTVQGNSVRFTPNLPDINEPTTVTFNYKISDGHSHDATGKVTVTVLLEALPKPPFARDDFADTETDQPVTIDVLANDTDPSGGGLPHLTTNPVCAGGGDAKRTPNDRVTFTPPRGQTGTFSCKYMISNTQGLGAEASIIVTVKDPPRGNQAPTINDSLMQPSVNLGGTLTFSANLLAADPDGDALVFSAVSKPTHGTTNFSSQTNTFTYRAPPAGSADSTPDSDNIQVIISDGHDGNVPGTISIKLIAEPPPAPTIPVPPKTHDISLPATTGVNLVFDVVFALQDDNIGGTLTLVAASADPGPGTAQAVNGYINIVPTAAGSLTVNYTVKNAAGATSSDKIKVTITDPPQANPPVAVDDSLIVPSGGVGSVDLLKNDGGINDPSDVVAVTLNNRPPASFGTVDLKNGVLSFVAAASAEGGQVSLTYTLKDGSGFQSTAQVLIVVQACSESPPQARDDSIFTPYMTPIDINLGSYIVSGNLQPGSVRGAGMTSITGTYTPPAGMNGTEVVTFVVENGCHQTDLGQLTIDVNHSPVGGTIKRNMSAADDPLTLTIHDLASDDEALTITGLTGNPPWANFNATTVTVAPPSGTRSDDYTFTATVQDPGGLTAIATITITISGTPPTAVPDKYNTTDSTITFDPTSNDFDAEPGQLCVQAISVTSPVETRIVGPDPQPPCMTQIMVSLAHGESKLSYTIRDRSGLTSSPATITIISNNSPTIAPADAQTNGQLTAETSVQITDVDGDDLTYSCMQGTDYFPRLRPPYSEDPNWELEVDVLPAFNNDPNHSVQFTCTVSDAFSSATAPMTLSVG